MKHKRKAAPAAAAPAAAAAAVIRDGKLEPAAGPARLATCEARDGTSLALDFPQPKNFKASSPSRTKSPPLSAAGVVCRERAKSTAPSNVGPERHSRKLGQASNAPSGLASEKTDTDCSVPEGFYVVDKILDRRTNAATGKFEYYVKWLGYPCSQNTWEPASSFYVRTHSVKICRLKLSVQDRDLVRKYDAKVARMERHSLSNFPVLTHIANSNKDFNRSSTPKNHCFPLKRQSEGALPKSAIMAKKRMVGNLEDRPMDPVVTDSTYLSIPSIVSEYSKTKNFRLKGPKTSDSQRTSFPSPTRDSIANSIADAHQTVRLSPTVDRSFEQSEVRECNTATCKSVQIKALANAARSQCSRRSRAVDHAPGLLSSESESVAAPHARVRNGPAVGKRKQRNSAGEEIDIIAAAMGKSILPADMKIRLDWSLPYTQEPPPPISPDAVLSTCPPNVHSAAGKEATPSLATSSTSSSQDSEVMDLTDDGIVDIEFIFDDDENDKRNSKENGLRQKNYGDISGTDCIPRVIFELDDWGQHIARIRKVEGDFDENSERDCTKMLVHTVWKKDVLTGGKRRLIIPLPQARLKFARKVLDYFVASTFFEE
ncbi:hypothetical protein HDU83_005863 [Entophlyctis luteolus]|nr:hypothetical protein HDU83_005863 [Entophlyctis luteolus]